MKLTRNILTLALLSVGVAYAGVYEKNVVTPAPLCGPWYMSMFGGGSFFDDGEWAGGSDPDFDGFGGQGADFGFGNGWIAGLAVGIRTQSDWRFELEGSHSQAPGESATFGFSDLIVPAVGDPLVIDSLGAGTLQGDVERTSLMLNIAKEFPGLALWSALRPYLGAGVGLSNVRTDLRSTTANGIPAELGGGTALVTNHYTGDEVVLGYQFMAGIVLDITECLQLYLEYRLQGSADPEDVSIETERVVSPVALPGDLDFGAGYGDLDLGWAQHAIVGVRWFF